MLTYFLALLAFLPLWHCFRANAAFGAVSQRRKLQLTQLYAKEKLETTSVTHEKVSIVGEGSSKLDEVFTLLNLLTTKELAKVAKKVKDLQRDRPILLPKFPKDLIHLQGKFTIFDKGCNDESHNFEEIYPDTVHSYQLVWSSGEKMDMKIANQRGVTGAGTTPYETQGLQVGPLRMVGTFPEHLHFPSYCYDLLELLLVCKKNGVVFESPEMVTSFLECYVIKGPNIYLWDAYKDGVLEEDFEEYSYDGKDEA